MVLLCNTAGRREQLGRVSGLHGGRFARCRSGIVVRSKTAAAAFPLPPFQADTKTRSSSNSSSSTISGSGITLAQRASATYQQTTATCR